ncbi:MAG: SUMF1/EgtB/PvdO family nonheme iron enzyme [Pseudomonadota bacterium]
MNPIDVGAQFDGYRLTGTIGAGGMGRVFLGHDSLLDRPVAVKFISTADPDPLARTRFLVEARAIARLNHPCVVAVYRAGEVDGQPYIVSEFVEGMSLDRLEIPAPWRETLPIAFDLARGLAVAHQAGVVHRDIKPANAILATDGTAKLLDFGIARLLARGGDAPIPAEVTARLRDEETRDPREARARCEIPDDATVDVALPARLLENPGWESGAHISLSRVSRAGQIMGTPAFMAPEVWCGEEATFASDVYSLGALLYTLCAGHPPHMADSIDALAHRVLMYDPPRLGRIVPEMDPRLGAIIDRCLERDPDRRYPSANELRSALAPLMSPAASRPMPEGNPYRGLRHFEEEHQAFFFGRDTEIRAIIDRLRTDPVVIVTGDSGVGKSSLCRAGVLSRAPEWMKGDETWSVATLVPGAHPVEAICQALKDVTGLPVEVLRDALAGGVSSFGRCLRQAQGPTRGLLLFVDQLEELLTLSEPEEAQIVGGLVGWSRDPVPGFRILSTVRADFLGRLTSLQGVGANLADLLYFLRPLSEDRIREAITGPAEATSLRFESAGMIDDLARSAAGTGGGLPLLQFALQKLWDLRDPGRQMIPASALDALGGVGGALSLHADELITSLGPTHREAARRLFLRLVTPEGTRARRNLEEIVGGDPTLQATLDALVRGRLVVAVETQDGTVFEVAHEALLTSWATLVRWLHEDVDARVVHDRLTVACAEWRRLDTPGEALWSGRLLEEARALEPGLLSPVEADFLAQSRRYARRAWLLKRLGVLAVLAALLGTYVAVRLRANHERDVKVEGHLTAGGSSLESAANLDTALAEAEGRAFDHFDRRQPQEGEAAWAEALELRTRVRGALTAAGRELETAVALDPGRLDARALFAEILYRRALEADARGADAEREELLGRMALYDVDDALGTRWNAPASLSLSTDEVGTTISLVRYSVGSDAHLVPTPVDAPTTLPWDALTLPPGSYRADLRLLTGGEVRLPFVLRRSEALSLDVPTAPLGAAPPGFVFVPPAHFLFGGGRDEELRRGFHHTVPTHEVQVKGYYIARFETTFGQWIEYLEALPPADRAARLPSVHAGGFEGALSLEDLGDSGWRISFKPTATRYSAVAGEPIVYPSRTRNQRQDWLRLPVVGLTAADAAAYAAWLDQSGRVPGARLCTDREWEFAARGADGREYPQGARLDSSDANFDETYDKDPAAMGPDAVGTHPASESPFGLHDTAGNVWEWVSSSLEPEGHAARGGSFYFGANTGRTYNRETPEPSFRDTSVGFRLCAELPPVTP